MHAIHPSVADLLAFVPLFAADPPRARRRIATRASVERHPSGTVLVRQDDPGGDVLVLAEGLAWVTIDGNLVGCVRPGGCIGELAALDGGPRTATVTTAVPSRVIRFDADAFEWILAEFPDVTQRILRETARRLRHADALADDLAG